MTLYAPSVDTFYIGDFVVEERGRSGIATLGKTYYNWPINDLHVMHLMTEDVRHVGSYKGGRNADTPSNSPSLETFEIVFHMVTGKPQRWIYELKTERDHDYAKFVSYGRQLPVLDGATPMEPDVPTPRPPTNGLD